MSSAGDERRAAAEVMLRPEEAPEPGAAAAAEESGARRLCRCPTPPPGEEVREMEETIEELLRRLDEFCGITDAIRSGTSEILDETIPLIKVKVMEMNHIYAKVDKLERHPSPAARSYDLPKLYRTEDFFPNNYVGTKYQNN